MLAPFFFLLERVATGLYILLGLGAAFFFWRWLRARREYYNASFELVRNLANDKRRLTLTRWVTFALLAALILFSQQVVIPYLRDTVPQATAEAAPEDLIFETPTSLPSGEVNLGDLAVIGPTPVPVTPSAVPTPVGTILPNVPPAAGCDSADARLQVPANGMRVFETIDVIGTTAAADFGSYKLEISVPGSAEMFAVLVESTTPLAEAGVLGQLVAQAFEPGEYQFRLTVFDLNNILTAACLVHITISAPP